jgi:ribosomal-protein-serine acetyltransferase
MLEISREFPASRIECGDLIIRPLQLSDAPQIMDAILESRQELKTFMPWSHLEVSLAQQVKRLQGLLTANAQGKDFHFGLFRDQHFLAGCGLHPRTALNEDALEIGFWVRSSQTGQGLATRLTQMLIIYAIEGLRLSRIQICHNCDNAGSRRVVEKCGFVSEGVIRNGLEAPTASLLEGGYSRCCDLNLYSLLPQEARNLAWYVPLRERMRFFNQLNQSVSL